MELNVITRGRVPWGAKREVAGTLRDCYQRFGSRSPYKVEVHIIDTEAAIREFLKDEKFRLGLTAGDDEGIVCSHDAWRGYPRLMICWERLAKFNKLARLGAVRHSASHSILHSSLEYDVFKIPEDCNQAAKIKAIDSIVVEQALYYLSAAVKDFEATRFLVEQDYIGCQFAFALEWLRPPGEDKAVKTNRQAKFLYEAALLKPVLFAHPLLALPRSKKISLEHQVLLGRRVEEFVECLGDAERHKFLQVTNIMAETFTEDTHKNVDFALLQAMSLA